MAVSAISSYSAAQVPPVGRSVAPTPRTSSAASTIVVSKVTVTNPDGSTTTIITYADGHTETETTRAATRQKSSTGAGYTPNGVGTNSSGGSAGQLVNVLA